VFGLKVGLSITIVHLLGIFAAKQGVFMPSSQSAPLRNTWLPHKLMKDLCMDYYIKRT